MRVHEMPHVVSHVTLCNNSMVLWIHGGTSMGVAVAGWVALEEDLMLLKLY